MLLLIECESNNFIVEERYGQEDVKNKQQAKNYNDRVRFVYGVYNIITRKHLS